jgi:hypothetical protein
MRLFRARAQVRPKPGTMNKTEALYAQILEIRKRAGEILDWAFEPEKFRLADKTFYTPDFRVIMPDFTVEFHEVKAKWSNGQVGRDDAKVKIKVAAEMHPYRFLIAVCDRGRWKWIEI